MSADFPDLDKLVESFPWGGLHGGPLDWLGFQMGKSRQRLARWFHRRPKVRPHRKLIGAAISEVVRCFDNPVCCETGCIRRASEGTDSTLTIASGLKGRGRFFSFEFEEKHIQVCKTVCKDYLEQINFIQGDAKSNLEKLKKEARFTQVHFAFFDSADDPAQTFAEFKAIEELFVGGSLVVVDDVIRGVKGKLIKPFMRKNPDWQVRLLYAGNGLLLARKNKDS